MSLIYIGAEENDLWRNSIAVTDGSQPFSVDKVGGNTGIVADVEGVTLYHSSAGTYLLASSQGNDSLAVYRGDGSNAFPGRFRIVSRGDIDGAQETDGIDATGTFLGDRFPQGILVAQDGFNRAQKQNFKVVDWRDIAAALRLDEKADTPE